MLCYIVRVQVGSVWGKGLYDKYDKRFMRKAVPSPARQARKAALSHCLQTNAPRVYRISSMHVPHMSLDSPSPHNHHHISRN